MYLPLTSASSGGGIVGTGAAKIAIGMGAKVTLVDLNLNCLRELDDIFHGRLSTLASNSYNVSHAVPSGGSRHRRCAHPRRGGTKKPDARNGLANEEFLPQVVYSFGGIFRFCCLASARDEASSGSVALKSEVGNAACATNRLFGDHSLDLLYI